MKKLTLLAFVLAMLLVGCSSTGFEDTSYQKDHTFNLVGFEEATINVIEKNAIMYVSVNQLLEVIDQNQVSIETSDSEIEAYSESDYLIFDVKNNEIRGDMNPFYGFYPLSKNSFPDDLKSVYEKERISFQISLEDFGVEFIIDNDQVYAPLELAIRTLFGKNINALIYDDKLIIAEAIDDSIIERSISKREIKYSMEQINYLYEVLYFELEYSSILKQNEVANLKSKFDDRVSDLKEPLAFYELLDEIFNEINDYHFMVRTHSLEKQSLFGSGVEFSNLFENEKGFNSSDDDKVTSYEQGDVLYIRIPSMYNTTYEEEVLDIISSSQQRQVILDLRGNSGGFISYSFLNKLVDDNLEVTYSTKNTVETTTINYKNSSIESYYDKDYIILVNKYCYSACSVTTLLAKENDIATIVGEDTSGGHSPIGVGMTTTTSNIIFSEGTSFIIPTNFQWVGKDGLDYTKVDVEFDMEVEELIENFKSYIR